jgi:hypothetical protein
VSKAAIDSAQEHPGYTIQEVWILNSKPGYSDYHTPPCLDHTLHRLTSGD